MSWQRLLVLALVFAMCLAHAERADARERQRVDQDLQQAFDELRDRGQQRGRAASVQRMARTERQSACGGQNARQARRRGVLRIV